MPNPIIHFDIGCRDRERSNAFYTSLFDWKTSDYGPFSKQIDPGTSEGIPGFLTALGHEPHNYVMVYVQVDDVSAILEKVTTLGGKIVVPETPVPGQGSFAWIQDPDENLMGVWKPES